MPESPTRNLLPQLGSRRDYFDYLDRWSVGTVEDMRAHMTTRALVKAFLLETSRSNGGRDAVAALESGGQHPSEVDATLFRLRWPSESQDWALLDVEDDRYPVLYTALESGDANNRVDRMVRTSALLDQAWFAAHMFRRLWNVVGEAFPHHRFSQMVFEYESLYESISEEPLSTDNEQEDSPDDGERIETERRRARMQIAERIGRLRQALEGMRPAYSPLESIVRLRIPAPQRGGIDVYFNGRFTNRSDSVTALRQTVDLVANLYRYATVAAEETAWPQSVDVLTSGAPVSLGAPLSVKFSEPLAPETFGRWVASLKRKNNRFRLWGNPILMGPGKVHFYAVDNHLWQPIDLEITTEHLFALLPAGTCGNTIHRLVTNIQRYVDPNPSVHIGDRPYQEIIEAAPTGGR